jgi:hypothetical protein
MTGIDSGKICFLKGTCFFGGNVVEIKTTAYSVPKICLIAWDNSFILNGF